MAAALFGAGGPAAAAPPVPPGTLDRTFGGDGRVTSNVAPGFERASAVEVQPDGRLLAGGFGLFEPSGHDFLVVRYFPDGSLDGSFGSGGVVTTGFEDGHEEAFDLALQDDGRFLVVGRTAQAGELDVMVARYLPDGSLDPTWGGDGIVVTDVAGSDSGAEVAVRPDGGVLVAGSSDVQVLVVSYRPDGSLDTDFGRGDGVVVTPVVARGLALAVQPDRRILVGGVASADFLLIRYGPSGLRDRSFGGDGIVTTDIAGRTDIVNSLALMGDGRVVAAGVTGQASAGGAFAMARYREDGSLDPSFGRDGKVVTNLTNLASDVIERVLVDAEERLVVGGVAGQRSVQGTNEDFVVGRYLGNGSLDRRFGEGGIVRTDFFHSGDVALGLALQPDGRIVLAGFAPAPDGDAVVALSRYIA